MVQRTVFPRYKGRMEHEQQEIIRDMTTGALAALASHDVLLGEHARIGLQRLIRQYVEDHLEIEAKVAMNLAHTTGPDAA